MIDLVPPTCPRWLVVWYLWTFCRADTLAATAVIFIVAAMAVLTVYWFFRGD